MSDNIKSAGKITKRNEKGQIAGKVLSSEEASALASKRWDKEKIEEIDNLLSEFGYTQESAPPHLRLLAQKAAVSGSGSVTALVQLIRALRESRSFDDGMQVRLRPGDLCPSCGCYYNVELSRDLIKQILEMTGGLPLIEFPEGTDNYA